MSDHSFHIILTISQNIPPNPVTNGPAGYMLTALRPQPTINNPVASHFK